MSNLLFRLMALEFMVRDLFNPPREAVGEAGLRPGMRVLDFGCGPGSFSIEAALAAGASGRVYALDIHPLALKAVREKASKKGIENIEAILSDCATGLPGESIDAVLLYDTYHDLSQTEEVLRELHRVLKPGGFLSFSDHHMKNAEIVSSVTGKGLFKLARKGKRTYTFQRQG